MITSEKDHTAQFDVKLLGLDATPSFAVLQNETVVASFTAQASGSGLYFALYAPNTEGAFIGEWRGARTLVNSARPIVKRFPFYVTITRAE